ncbi:hypothetical protein ARALYDRAFT_890484 [Arabidopsis lyrata subsp. lyrata]|uniref:C3H1-type domain-containing protein n=1 Tax=Arabidopsis lyrata subsp. lyrata TaxID=81972 RepID=D7KDV3_ARALL|nr:hypothetical protein ARALYDRAFT_890484 [Arabidopsis lyrata subsp. lyrata]
MADARENQQESERRSDETESISIEEPKEKEDEDENLQEQRQSSIGSSIPSSAKRKERMTQSSPYPVRPGVENCQCYIKTGLCRFGSSCRYNHPNQRPQVRIDAPICKYFLKGSCKFGSACIFQHIMDRNVAEPMYQSKIVPDSQMPDPRGHEAQENLQEQRQRDSIERQGREAQENLHQQRFQDMPENQAVNAQQNLQEQRRISIENERTEARLRIEQIRPTVAFPLNEYIRARVVLHELGFVTDSQGSFLGPNRCLGLGKHRSVSHCG